MTSYGVMCVTKIQLRIENGSCDYYHLLLQLICAFFKMFLILMY